MICLLSCTPQVNTQSLISSTCIFVFAVISCSNKSELFIMCNKWHTFYPYQTCKASVVATAKRFLAIFWKGMEHLQSYCRDLHVIKQVINLKISVRRLHMLFCQRMSEKLCFRLSLYLQIPMLFHPAYVVKAILKKDLHEIWLLD